ncbi:hypothetical protein JCM10213_001870 [Rhodosporidiobolus nylandii]
MMLCLLRHQHEFSFVLSTSPLRLRAALHCLFAYLLQDLLLRSQVHLAQAHNLEVSLQRRLHLHQLPRMSSTLTTMADATKQDAEEEEEVADLLLPKLAKRGQKRRRSVIEDDEEKGEAELDSPSPSSASGHTASAVARANSPPHSPPAPSSAPLPQATPSPPAPAEIIHGEEFWLVEAILAEEWRKGKRWYRVKWEGFPLEETTWEPRRNVKDTEALQRWVGKQAEKAQGRGKRRRIA